MSNKEVKTQKEIATEGLNKKEIQLLNKWIEEGKPGLTKYKAERLGEIYCLGYTCEDIRRWFPEYPIEVLLWARVNYAWDDIRTQYRKIVQQETLNAAIAARMESIRFLADVVTATHVKYRKDLLQYIADPINCEAPKKILPDNIHSYGYLINLLKDITTPSQDKNMTDKSVPLVTVNVGDNGKSEVKVSSQNDIREALLNAEKDTKNNE